MKSGSTSDDWLVLFLDDEEVRIEPNNGVLRAIDIPGMGGDDVLVVVDGLEEALRLEVLAGLYGMEDAQWASTVAVDDQDFMECLDIKEFEARLRRSKEVPVPGHAEMDLRSVNTSLPPYEQTGRLSPQAYSFLKGAAVQLGLKDEYGSLDYVVTDNPLFLPDILTEAICAAEEMGL